MKVKVIAEAYYNNSLVYEGQIINYKGDKLPSWATLADGIETKKSKKNKEPEAPIVPEEDGEGEKDVQDEGQGDTVERVEYLNMLIDEGIEKGILIEDADKKSVEEQIQELEILLKGDK